MEESTTVEAKGSREETTKKVLWLEALSERDGARCGGKAKNLAELSKNGHPVPLGFVITTDGFDAFVRDNGLVAALRTLLKDGGDPTEWQKAVCAANWPKELRKLVADHLAQLQERSPGAGIAVRSSATDED